MSIEFELDLQEINLLQQEFDVVVGKRKNSLPSLSHNPVLDRWHAEKVKEGEEESFRKHELQQLKTMLSERYQVMCPSVTYTIDSSCDIYHEKLTNEPFLKILQRGQAYRKEVGSNELIREQKEIDGWFKVFQIFSRSDIIVGTKIVVISGPGLVENTAYPHNFVDIFTKTEDRTVRMTRFYSSLDYASYSQKAKDWNENYFENFEGPMDAWFLSHPICVDQNNTKKSAKEVFRDLFGKSGDVLKQEDLERLFRDCMPIIEFYINVLCDPEYKPEEIAVAFNAVINEADRQKELLKKKSTEKIVYINFENIRQRIDYLGHQPVQNIRAGCGLSGGFDLNGQKQIFNLLGINIRNSDLFANSVAQFGTEQDDFGQLKFQCTKGHWNTRPYGKLITKCCIKGCKGEVGCIQSVAA